MLAQATTHQLLGRRLTFFKGEREVGLGVNATKLFHKNDMEGYKLCCARLGNLCDVVLRLYSIALEKIGLCVKACLHARHLTPYNTQLVYLISFVGRFD